MDNPIFFHIFNDDKNKLETQRIIKLSIFIVFSIFFILLIDVYKRQVYVTKAYLIIYGHTFFLVDICRKKIYNIFCFSNK